MNDDSKIRCRSCQFQNGIDAKFCSQCGSSITEQSTADSDPEPTNPTRRHLTVLFCDLVGSVQLSQSLDAEELRRRLTEYHEICSQAAERTGGHVAQYLGDGVLIYFGYPVAQEDSARRAMQCGRLILDTLQRRNGDELVARLGADSGEVVVSTVGTGTSREDLALGETPNIAARIQSLAKPGRLYVSSRTWMQGKAFFVGHSVGPQSIKGVDEPLELWVVDSQSQAHSRVEGANAVLSPFVGREEQLEALLEFVSDDLQTVTVADIVGEPGIGKSRLILELRRATIPERYTTLSGYCGSDALNTPFAPFLGVVRDCIRLDGRADATQIETRLHELKQHSAERVGLLCHLLGADVPPGTLDNLDGLIIASRTRDLVINLICAQEPAVVFIEDLHWIDSSSELLLEQLIRSGNNAGIRVLTTRRPEYRPKYLQSDNVRTISLTALNNSACLALLKSRLRDTVEPRRLTSLVERSNGNALFAEELAEFVSKGNSEASVPDSINALLTARIEALSGQARYALQLASAIGRQFTAALLHKVVGVNLSLAGVLQQSVEAEILHQTGTEHYQFKHALIQDTLYQSMLREQRAAAHLDVAMALEEDYANRHYEVAEQLAHHYGRSANYDKALQFHLLAGVKGLNNYALHDAQLQLDAALELVERSKTQPSIEVLIRLLSQQQHLLIQRFELRRSMDLYERYRPQVVGAPDSIDVVEFFSHSSFAAVMTRQYPISVAAAQLALDVAKRLDRPHARAQGRSAVLFARIHDNQSLLTLQEIKSIESRIEDDLGAANQGFLPSWVRMTSAWAFLFGGYFDEARERANALLQMGQQQDDARAIGLSYLLLGWMEVFDENWDSALALGQQCMDSAVTPFDYHIGLQILGFSTMAKGDPVTGLSLLNKAIEAGKETGFEYVHVGCTGGKATALALVGRISEGLIYIENGIAESERINDEAAVAFQSLFYAELLIELLAAEEKPPVMVLLRNLPRLLRLKSSGAKQAQELLAKTERKFNSYESRFRNRIEADRALLFAVTGRAQDARDAIARAKRGLADDASDAITRKLNRAISLIA